MKRKTYLHNALLLTLAGFALRAGGMLLRVYLAGALGGEGMGLYQLVFTAYGVFVAVSNSGVTAAASRLTAEELTDSPGRALGAVQRVLQLSLLLGLLAGGGQLLLARTLAGVWLGDSRAALPLQILAPSLPCMAVSAALRGCFLALGQVGPNVRSQLAEQLLRLGLVFWLVPLAGREDLRLACGAVVAGNLAGEALSCLWLLAAWRRQKRRWRSVPAVRSADLDRRLWQILIPVEGSHLTESLLHAAENVLVPACLLDSLGRTGALAAYGALRGMALPLLLFPYSFLSSLSALLLPEIARAHGRGDRAELGRLIDRLLLFTGAFALLAGGLFGLYGRELALLVYGDGQAALYVQLLSPALPFLYMESMVDGALKGLGEQLACFRYHLWDSCLRIGAILLLLPRFGMAGLAGILLASHVLLCALSVRRLLWAGKASFSAGRLLFLPLLALLPAGLLGQSAAARAFTPWGRVLAGGTVTGLVFCLLWGVGVLWLADKKKDGQHPEGHRPS